MNEDLLDNLKVAALCFFIAPIIWTAGAPVVAIAAVGAGLLILFVPPLVLEHVNHGVTARFFRLLLGGLLLIAVTAWSIYAAYEYQQCRSHTGNFDFLTLRCR